MKQYSFYQFLIIKKKTKKTAVTYDHNSIKWRMPIKNSHRYDSFAFYQV